MTTWILVVVMCAGGSPQVTSGIATKAQCEAAGREAVQKMGSGAKAVCVEAKQ